MGTEEQDLSLIEEDAESVLGGKNGAQKLAKRTTVHAGYVLGDTGVVNPSSSGMAGDTSGSDDEC